MFNGEGIQILTPWNFQYFLYPKEKVAREHVHTWIVTVLEDPIIC